MQALLRSGVAAADVERLVWDNPIDVFAQGGRLDRRRLEDSPMASRREPYDVNSVLRGQDPDRL